MSKHKKPENSNDIIGRNIIAALGSAAHTRIETAFDEFRMLFPASLCYTKIVPVDEAVTLTLFYREDQHLQRLMLTDDQIKQLDRYWDELFSLHKNRLSWSMCSINWPSLPRKIVPISYANFDR